MFGPGASKQMILSISNPTCVLPTPWNTTQHNDLQNNKMIGLMMMVTNSVGNHKWWLGNEDKLRNPLCLIDK